MNSDFGLSAHSLNMIRDTLSQFPEIKDAIIFGSRAMGKYKKGSDVDIALKGDVNQDTIVKIYVILDQKLPLPYKFDLVKDETIDNLELKAHIDQHGISFLSR